MRDDDPAQQLCRTANDGGASAVSPTKKPPKRTPRTPWAPTPEWRAQFTAQATREMTDAVTAYAASCGRALVAYKNGRRNPSTVEEMVHDATGDTFRGIVKWNPARCTLEMHLKSVIRSRVAHEYDREDDIKHYTLGHVSDRRLSSAIAIDVAPSVAGRVNRSAEAFTTQLRGLAAGDEPVLQLIDCYREGITERRKVCAATGMTKGTFHNADRRLKRLVKSLPEDVCADALASLTRNDR
jgi:hypothetical protein